MEAPLGQLERAFIDAYVRSQGHDPAHLDALPEGERDALLKAASIHASAKLSEVEARSHLLKDLHDGAPRTSQKGLE
jgi:hypothetical protein